MLADQNRDEMKDNEAYEYGLALLRRCQTARGFVSSPNDTESEARIWTRDGVMAGLAAIASGDQALIKTFSHTLETIASCQGKHGEIPSNVSLDGSIVSYGRLTGRVDAPLWYVIGVCAYLKHARHNSEVVKYWLSVEQAMNLIECWEYNDRSLIYTPLTGNWADEYVQQGYVLADQLLYEIALRSAGELFSHKDWLQEADVLRKMLEINYWPSAEHRDDPAVYHEEAYRYQLEHGQPQQYWLPAFSPVGYVSYFDGLAHALALIVDLGSDAQRQQVDSFVQELEQQIGHALLPAFWPVIHPQDSAWSSMTIKQFYGQIKNQPYMYHNGGLWPVLTGLYIIGLVKHQQSARAGYLLDVLNAANAMGREQAEWEFAEYHHGQSYQPMGLYHQAWSAAAGVLAHQAVQGRIPWPL